MSRYKVVKGAQFPIPSDKFRENVFRTLSATFLDYGLNCLNYGIINDSD